MTTTAIPSMQNNGPRNLWDAIENDTYEARLVKCVGLGVQEQPEWQGQKKQPAFKMAMTFELIDVDATGVDRDGKPLEPRPACQFKDYFLFPGAKRGGVYDLVRAIDPSLEAVPNNLEWFEKALGSVINVEVGSYTTKAGVLATKLLVYLQYRVVTKNVLVQPAQICNSSTHTLKMMTCLHHTANSSSSIVRC